MNKNQKAKEDRDFELVTYESCWLMRLRDTDDEHRGIVTHHTSHNIHIYISASDVLLLLPLIILFLQKSKRSRHTLFGLEPSHGLLHHIIVISLYIFILSLLVALWENMLSLRGFRDAIVPIPFNINNKVANDRAGRLGCSSCTCGDCRRRRRGSSLGIPIGQTHGI